MKNLLQRLYALSCRASALAALLAFCSTVEALTLTNSLSIAPSGGTIPGAGGEVINVQTSDSRTFWWADKSGTGLLNAASQNLDMQGYTISKADTNGIVLDLNGGSISSGAKISTSASAANNGTCLSLIIRNAGNIQITNLDLRNTSAFYSCGDVTFTNVGDIAISNIWCCRGDTFYKHGGGTIIQTNGNLNILDFEAWYLVGTPSASYTNDPIFIHGAGGGSIACIGQILHSCGTPADVIIENYGTLNITGTNGIDNRYTASAYLATHPGRIILRNIGSGGCLVGGPLQTYSLSVGEGGASFGGDIIITNIGGTVSIQNADTHNVPWGLSVASSENAGDININAAGSITTRGLTTYYGNSNMGANGANAGNITISNFRGNVTVGNLDTRDANSNAAASVAGSITLTAGGNLTVTGGVITLYAAYGPTKSGVLSLTTIPGSGGSIYVNSLTTDVFDVSQMQNVQFNSASGNSYLAGVLTSFPTGSTGGSGTLASPFVTTQTVLRVSANQTLYYWWSPGGLNASLGGTVYKVAATNGTAGTGGLLVGVQIGSPQIANVAASNTTDRSATLVGNLVAGQPADVICYWGASDGGVSGNWANTNDLGPQAASGLVANPVTGLAANTTYYFRYVASNSIATAWAAPTMSFTTLLPQGAPVITNLWATNLTTTSASLVGNLTTGAAPVDVICYWGTYDGLTVAANWANTNDFGTTPVGVVTTNLTGLMPNTTYYFRYYAGNATSNYWSGNTVSFTTLFGPSVNNGAGATNIFASGATLQGTVTAGVPSPSAWIYWGTTDGLQVKDNWGQFIPFGTQSGGFSSAVANLTANQTYWYSCYASNNVSEAWATSTNFTTLPPTLTIGNAGVTEGAQGINTDAVLAVTLNTPSAVPVSVSYATANGPYARAGIDYTGSSGTLTIPAGVVSTQLTVSVLGGDVFSPTKTVYMNLSSPSSVTLGNAQGVVTIVNTNATVYVRGDGFGSDTNNGGSWVTAFATLTNALAVAPLVNATITRDQMSNSTPFRINVQASAAGTYYQAATRNTGYASPAALDLDIEGGWQNVANAPVQTGLSVVQDAATNNAGLSLQAGGHKSWRRVVVNGFAFSNVTRGVEIVMPVVSALDQSDILLTVSNTSVFAKNDGIYISYLKGYPASSFGGLAKLTAGNVAIVAGQGGVGHGVCINGSWQGSSIAASGNNPATGQPWVSAIVSASGAGVYLAGYNNEVRNASFANTVIYNCASNGVSLDGALQGGLNANGNSVGAVSNSVQATFLNCTIADNIGDGLHMLSSTNANYANVTNCIFAHNSSGHAMNLACPAGGITCAENDNVFSGNDLLVAGSGQAVGSNTVTADPMFWAQGAKPSPWYWLGSKSGPAYHNGSDGRDRGAYQVEQSAAGTAFGIW